MFIALSASCTTNDMATNESNENVDDEEQSETDEEIKLTLTELKKYNGQNGKPAYVAVDGIIYDVTNVSHWSGGSHNGQNAGRDITNAIQGAPHGNEVLDNVDKVGTVTE